MKNWIISDKNLLIFRYLSRCLPIQNRQQYCSCSYISALFALHYRYFISDAVSRTRGNGKRVRLNTISILCLVYRFLIQRVYKSITSTAACRWHLMYSRKFPRQLSWLWVVGPVRWGAQIYDWNPNDLWSPIQHRTHDRKFAISSNLFSFFFIWKFHPRPPSRALVLPCALIYLSGNKSALAQVPSRMIRSRFVYYADYGYIKRENISAERVGMMERFSGGDLDFVHIAEHVSE